MAGKLNTASHGGGKSYQSKCVCLCVNITRHQACLLPLVSPRLQFGCTQRCQRKYPWPHSVSQPNLQLTHQIHFTGWGFWWLQLNLAPNSVSRRGECSNIIPDSKLNCSSSVHIRVGYICDEAVFVKKLDEVIMPAAKKKLACWTWMKVDDTFLHLTRFDGTCR